MESHVADGRVWSYIVKIMDGSSYPVYTEDEESLERERILRDERVISAKFDPPSSWNRTSRMASAARMSDQPLDDAQLRYIEFLERNFAVTVSSGSKIRASPYIVHRFLS